VSSWGLDLVRTVPGSPRFEKGWRAPEIREKSLLLASVSLDLPLSILTKLRVSLAGAFLQLEREDPYDRDRSDERAQNSG
jgi:hypothetical protein